MRERGGGGGQGSKLISDGGPSPELHGVIVLDKLRGPTSHDVVAGLRRVLRTSSIGHAGTLDPMASGVLVALVGEATKLGAYLTAHEKRYEARVVFGVATTTLDAEGKVTEEQVVPPALSEALEQLRRSPSESGPPLRLSSDGVDGSRSDPNSVAFWRARLEVALEVERARVTQIPPAHSAIKVQGQKSYDRARAGEHVELEPRPVSVSQLRIDSSVARPPQVEASRPYLDLELVVSKGYYVRSLARDLGSTLGFPAHLSGLRRTASGPFAIADAVRMDEGVERLRAALRPLADVARVAIPPAVLTEQGAGRAKQGKRLTLEDFTTPPTDPSLAAWFDPAGCLVAIGENVEGFFQVRRGFRDG